MSDSKLLSVIVVSYNTAAITAKCLTELIAKIKSSEKLNKQTEIIVVDNGSQDDSVKQIKKIQASFKSLKLIAHTKNLGFGKANNLGALQAKGEYLFFLNSDAFVKDQTLERLIDATAKNNGLVAAQLLNQDGSIQPQGGDLPNLLNVLFQFFFVDDLPLIGKFFPSPQHTGMRFFPSKSKMVRQDWIAATALMVSNQTWNQLGGFDRNIFMYGEDMELSLRAKNHGLARIVVTNAPVIHLGSASSSNENARWGEMQGLIYIWKKHKPFWQIPILVMMLKLACYFRSGVFLLFGKPQLAHSYSRMASRL